MVSVSALKHGASCAHAMSMCRCACRQNFYCLAEVWTTKVPVNSIAKVSLLKCPIPILSDVFEQFVRQVPLFHVKAMGCAASAPPPPRQCKKPGCLKQAHPTQGHGFCCYGCSQNWTCGPLCTGVKTMKCWRPECHRMKHSREGTGYCCWGCKRGQGHDTNCENRPFHSEPAAPAAPAAPAEPAVPAVTAKPVPVVPAAQPQQDSQIKWALLETPTTRFYCRLTI